MCSTAWLLLQDVISACWAGSPEDRPSAPALVQKLTELVPVHVLHCLAAAAGCD